MIISPELQKSLIDHIENYITVLGFQRATATEWSADQEFYDKIDYRIMAAQADLDRLKSLE
jgi:hypothetical protein